MTPLKIECLFGSFAFYPSRIRAVLRRAARHIASGGSSFV
jgi:hypothetical protein